MSKTAVTRVTHSCHLIEIGGRTFLTDPWFSARPGYYQGEPIAVGIPDLPRLDGVLISHDHYDHCDLEAFAAYRDQAVPLFVAETVVEAARKDGFRDVIALALWQEVEVGGVTITAAPAKHGVYEVTFVLRSGPQAVYFAGDTMLIPELGQIPQRLGHISLALLPTNGLRIKPAGNMQVVMNAREAAELTAILKPERAPEHRPRARLHLRHPRAEHRRTRKPRPAERDPHPGQQPGDNGRAWVEHRIRRRHRPRSAGAGGPARHAHRHRWPAGQHGLPGPLYGSGNLRLARTTIHATTHTDW